MAHRRAPEADNDLDEIAIGIAERGGSFGVAKHLISEITARFYLLAQYPHLGRAPDDDLGAGRRSFVVGDYVIIVSKMATFSYCVSYMEGGTSKACLVNRDRTHA